MITTLWGPRIFPTDSSSFPFSFHLPLSDSSPTRGVLLFGGWVFWEWRQSGTGRCPWAPGTPSVSHGVYSSSISAQARPSYSPEFLLLLRPKPPGGCIRTENNHNPPPFFCEVWSYTKWELLLTQPPLPQRGAKFIYVLIGKKSGLELCKAGC